MLSQKLYFEIRQRMYDTIDRYPDPELAAYIRPYVFVLHKDGRGFYLDREYRHILDVKNCLAPTDCVEITEEHLCASSDLPNWALQANHKDFTSFWLY